MNDNETSYRTIFAVVGAAAIVGLLAGIVLGAMLYVATCYGIAPHLAPDGRYLGPELLCPVPPWYGLR